MKKIIVFMAILAAGLQAMAQEPRNHEFNKKLFEAKVAEMVYRLDMNDAQKAKFVPIYEDYTKAMLAKWKKGFDPQNRAKDEAARMKMRMQMQKEAQAVRMDYIDRFATVLNDKQLEQLYKVEDEIQKKLRERYKKMHQNGERKRHEN